MGWYERMSELEPGQVFKTHDGAVIRLDQRVPGDATDWYCDIWIKGIPGVPNYSEGHWSSEMAQYHPGDLIERLDNNYSDVSEPSSLPKP